MKDLTIIVHQDHVDDLIESLHDRGMAEISQVDRDPGVSDLVERKGIHESIKKFTEYEMKISSILDIFDRLEPERGIIEEFLSPDEVKKIDRRKIDSERLFSEINETFQDHGDEILKLDEKLSEIEKKIQDIKKKRESVEYLSQIEDEVELSLFGKSSFSVIEAGITKDPREFIKRIKELGSYFYQVEQIEIDDEDRYIVLAGTHTRDEIEFQKISRQTEVRPLDLEGIKGTPKRALKKLDLKIIELKDSRDKIIEKLKDFKDEHEIEYRVLKEELDIHREKKEVLQRFGDTDHTTVLKGWVLDKDSEKVEKMVEDITEGYAEVVFEEPENPSIVPTKLDNPRFIKPFEVLTNMFAPPKYDEIDPTFILAPAFVIFFGTMLGDAIYGLLITLTSLLLIKGIGRIDESVRNFSLVLLGTGLSTMILGILQGGYLGPAQDTHTNLFGRLGLDFINDLAVLETLEGEGPLTLLIISLVIGLFYLNTGIFLQFINYLKKKKYGNILKENLSWWTLQPGGFILISGLLFEWFDFTSAQYTIAWGLTGVGLVLLVLRAKGLSFFEITGFLGDFLSFSRILALGLATSGIALTVNVLADLISSPSVTLPFALLLLAAGLVITIKGLLDSSIVPKSLGLILLLIGFAGFLGYRGYIDPRTPFYVFGIVVAIGGHLMNAVLQALGAFVHSLRLQYVEFFGYFYEGGGSKYTPFMAERKYSKVERNEAFDREEVT